MRMGEEAQEDIQPYTQEEVRAGLEALESFEKAKLRKISQILCGKADMECDDLYQEAVCRMLTTRSCPNNVPIIAFAVMTMKGIASDAWRARVKQTTKGPTTIHYAANDADPVSHDLSPEESAIISQQCRNILSRLEGLIADNEPMQLLVEGLLEGLRGKDLEELVGVDTLGLAALRKQLVRLRSKASLTGNLQ